MWTRILEVIEVLVISKPLDVIWNLIGEQKVVSKISYRPITYHIKVNADDKFLLYNSLTREILLLSDDEWSEFNYGKHSEYLIKHWFLVPDKYDDPSLLYMVQQTYKVKYSRSTYGKLNLCTIATTTDCNARCPYCYERGISKKNMSDEVAIDVAKYIIQRSNRNVTLNWFGGEPLYNSRVIDIICEHLKTNGFPFKSIMTSNGYLLKDIPINKIVESWNMKRVQITLDGMEKTYNKTKSYIYKDTSPFKIVTDNIEKLIDADIFVNIRLNLSEENIQEMFSLVEWIYNRYPNKKNLGVYSKVLFNITDSQREALFKRFFDLQNWIKQLGLSKPINHTPGVKRCHCMADDGRSTVINPDGNLSLCEHFLDSESYGSIYGGRNDRNVLNRFLERQDQIPECKTCFYLPQCIRLKMCMPEGACDKENRELVEWQTKNMIRDVYKAKVGNNESNNI